MFLIVLLYIVEAKKGCEKNSLNILSLAADLLNSTSRYLDDFLNIDNPYFEEIVSQIYSPQKETQPVHNV